MNLYLTLKMSRATLLIVKIGPALTHSNWFDCIE